MSVSASLCLVSPTSKKLTDSCLCISAVVYLVREVLYDPDLTDHSASADHSVANSTPSSSLPDCLSQTPKASDGFATLMSPATSSQPPRRRRRRRGETDEVIYGRDFALKCLSKRDLSDELLLLQRGEAELHRALPSHENIVALHRVGTLFLNFILFTSNPLPILMLLLES